MVREIPWVCKTCGFSTDKWDPYLRWTIIGGKRRKVLTTKGTVMDHQMQTGHRTWSRKAGPRI